MKFTVQVEVEFKQRPVRIDEMREAVVFAAQIVCDHLPSQDTRIKTEDASGNELVVAWETTR